MIRGISPRHADAQIRRRRRRSDSRLIGFVGGGQGWWYRAMALPTYGGYEGGTNLPKQGQE